MAPDGNEESGEGELVNPGLNHLEPPGPKQNQQLAKKAYLIWLVGNLVFINLT